MKGRLICREKADKKICRCRTHDDGADYPDRSDGN